MMRKNEERSRSVNMRRTTPLDFTSTMTVSSSGGNDGEVVRTKATVDLSRIRRLNYTKCNLLFQEQTASILEIVTLETNLKQNSGVEYRLQDRMVEIRVSY